MAGGRDLELVGYRVAVDDERVVAGGLQGRRPAGKHAGTLVVDPGGLAVHHLRCPDDVSTPGRTAGLVA